ncbi:helix-turn-helix domain-containing protein [Nocardia sp. N2S4-5]|uniref:helix-turn-helix domain-containing protein n=1 Tax=Nocardia sp. N2S4-5 TaxID=3351565 RepID=UPI0037D784AC
MTELGRFLFARRSGIEPGGAGFRTGSRRRVPGLRREELAQLAGISAEYYQRLEQGRAANPSDQVLDALAEALDLSRVEREYLRHLARPPEAAEIAGCDARPELRRMLELLDNVPAVIITDTFDLLASNARADDLFEPLGRPANLARALFTDGAAREFYVEWDQVAAATAAQLRMVAGRYPADSELSKLIEDLSKCSTDFASLWGSGRVDVRTHGSKSFRHPRLGVVVVDYENFDLPGDPRRRLVVFAPAKPESSA